MCLYKCVCVHVCMCVCVCVWFHPDTSSTELVLQSLFISMVQVLTADVVSFEREHDAGLYA